MVKYYYFNLGEFVVRKLHDSALIEAASVRPGVYIELGVRLAVVYRMRSPDRLSRLAYPLGHVTTHAAREIFNYQDW